MTHEEKQQLKARFFGMHIGAPVACFDTVETHGINNGVFKRLNGVFHCEMKINEKLTVGELLRHCKLILRPLSDITDQEAIECIELSGQPFGHLIAIDRSNKHIVLEDHREHLLNLTNLSEKTKVADYLRSQHFALPFHGLDVVVEGWAVLETTNQPTGETKQK